MGLSKAALMHADVKHLTPADVDQLMMFAMLDSKEVKTWDDLVQTHDDDDGDAILGPTPEE